MSLNEPSYLSIIAANCSRVANPSGASLFPSVPLISPASTAHSSGSFAQSLTFSSSANGERSALSGTDTGAEDEKRNSIVASCSRVMNSSGPNVVSVSPLTTPVSFAHATASVYHSPSGTSVKPPGAVGAGEPSRRHRTVATIARVSDPSGSNLPPPTPFM